MKTMVDTAICVMRTKLTRTTAVVTGEMALASQRWTCTGRAARHQLLSVRGPGQLFTVQLPLHWRSQRGCAQSPLALPLASIFNPIFNPRPGPEPT